MFDPITDPARDLAALIDSYVRPNGNPDRLPGEDFVAVLPQRTLAWFPCRYTFPTMDAARAAIRRRAGIGGPG